MEGAGLRSLGSVNGPRREEWAGRTYREEVHHGPVPASKHPDLCFRLSKTTSRSKVTERDGEHVYITRLRDAMKIAIFSPSNAIRLTRPLTITIAPPPPPRAHRLCTLFIC